ncbi:class Ib ribonucleoside-diphosphate reductase assembly flavoprotein NrdI [Fundicoccus sp. Sow4_D5]|uniref:class Ib ribonucleoside-diphosphate reductase assembly flavoprotein NrdI n=1 Tax=unclassified Fundicoccus TaxID=2761543 RepID=UPI003F8F0481
MLVVFMSLTGQTRKFVKKLGWPSLEITLDNAFTEVDEPFIFVAPTYETEATDIIGDFLETGANRNYLKGFAGSGNLNFGKLYCFTAKDYSRDYKVPLLHLFEFQGTPNDIEQLKKEVEQLG